jgi:hypothetical protein
MVRRTSMFVLVGIMAVVMQIAPPVPRQAANARGKETQSPYDSANRTQSPTASSFLVNPFGARPDKNASENQKTEDDKKSVSITELPTVSVDRSWQDYLTLALHSLWY